jgi:exosortase
VTPEPSARPTAAAVTDIAANDEDVLLPWLVIGLGLAALYGPTMWDLLHEFWLLGHQPHGVLVLAAGMALLTRIWPCLRGLPADRRLARPAYAVVVLSSAMYALGRSQEIMTLEAASFVSMMAGCTLLLRGQAGVRLHAFTLPFLLLFVPWPIEVVDAIEPPLLSTLCLAAATTLQAAGMAAVCTSTSLLAGGHELRLLEASPGISTHMTLLALALLYLRLVDPAGLGHHDRWLRRGWLIFLSLLLLVPAASGQLLVAALLGQASWITHCASLAAPYLGLALVLGGGELVDRLMRRLVSGMRPAEGGKHA